MVCILFEKVERAKMKSYDLDKAPYIEDLRELLSLYFLVKNNLKAIRTDGRIPVDKGKWADNILDTSFLKHALLKGKRISFNITSLSAFGILTGACNDLVVIDCDNHNKEHAGIDNLAHLLKLSKDEVLKKSFAVKTPSGGYHLYFRSESADTFKTTSGDIAFDVDTRCQGGLIVSPYSFRFPKDDKAGGWYTPVSDSEFEELYFKELAKVLKPPYDIEKIQMLSRVIPSLEQEIPMLPKDWISILPKKEEKQKHVSFMCKPIRNLYDSIGKYDKALNIIKNAPKGERNNVLYRKSVFLFKHFKDVATLEDDLIYAGLSSGLPLAEVQATIKSAHNACRL